jgi:hypothetical protein
MLVSFTSQYVRSFHKDEKQKEFITAMKRRQTYAAVLQKSGGFGETQKDNSGYLILNHGPPGTILSPDAQKAWTLAGSQVLRFGPRILAIRLQMEDAKGRQLTIFFGSGYAPHSGRPQAEKGAYAAQLQCCHDTAGPKEVFIRLNKGEDDSGRPIDPKQARDAVRQAQQGMSGVKEIRPM